MTPSTLAELKQIFFHLDSDKTGYITFDKLKDAMDQLGLDIASDELMRVIDEVDCINFRRHGYISFTTFITATINLKEKISEKLLKDTFSYFDT